MCYTNMIWLNVLHFIFSFNLWPSLLVQDCLEKFLQGTGGLQNRELLMVHYLQQANYIPALQLNQTLKMNLVVCAEERILTINIILMLLWAITCIIRSNKTFTLTHSFHFLCRMSETQRSESDPTPGTLYWTSMAKFCPECRGNWRWSDPNLINIHPPFTKKVALPFVEAEFWNLVDLLRTFVCFFVFFVVYFD